MAGRRDRPPRPALAAIVLGEHRGGRVLVVGAVQPAGGAGEPAKAADGDDQGDGIHVALR
jgi:hypothetical protein